MANTYESLGDQATLDALVAHTLTTFEDDRVLQVGNYAFHSQSQLTKVILPNCTRIDNNAFYGCSGLQEIWIDSSSVPTIQSGSLPSQFASGTGAIYVPANMVASYRANSSWSAWKWHVVSKEDYPVTNFDLIKDSLSEMCTKLANGTANYDIGDFKTIDLGTEGKIKIQVAAKNVDELSSGGTNAAYTWIAMDLLKTNKVMNPKKSGTTEGTGGIGGWSKCQMRTYLSTTIWALLPAELQAVIKEVKKYSCVYDTSLTKIPNEVTNDKLWIPSIREVFNSSTYETTGPAYTEAFPRSTSLKRFKPEASSATTWWLRTSGGDAGFKVVSNGGVESYDNSELSYAILLGFCT